METRRLGSVSYPEAWSLQLELIEKRASGEISDTLLLLEHPHVITYGKRSPEKDSIPTQISGVPTFAVERGGESTYHGPGQLVAYPIFQIPERMGPKGFLRVLEKTIIRVLQSFDLQAFAIPEKTGVWLLDKEEKEKKIASLGIAVRKGVSYHGLSLNVSPELKYFSLISPCGFKPEVMTSMQSLLGKAPSMQEIETRLEKEIQEEWYAAFPH